MVAVTIMASFVPLKYSCLGSPEGSLADAFSFSAEGDSEVLSVLEFEFIVLPKPKFNLI